jgi:two-component system nitrogen regulation sensor histidine kinase NtrY
MVSGASDTGNKAGSKDGGKRGRLSRAFANATSKPVFYLGLVIVVLSLLSGIATYVILTGLTPIVPDHTVVVTMLLTNGVLVLAMIAMIGWQLAGLWQARRRQAAGSRLHARIVGLFSVIAVLPAIVLAIFASVSLDRGLDHWFSSRTKSIIQNSITVATAYLNEHGQVIRADAVSMAADIDQAVELVRTRPEQFGRFLTAQADVRSIEEAHLVDGEGKVLATAGTLKEDTYTPPPPEALEAGKGGKAVVIAPGKSNKVGAVMKLRNFSDTYLYIIQSVNPKVLQHLRETRANVREYQQLEERRTGVQIAFGLMYLAIALTLLLAAIWAGLWFANRLVAPIRRLIAAAQQISAGKFDVQVDSSPSEGDLAQLGATFNKMTSDLRSQRNELVDANTKLDERRRFTEAVLSGVTAGVIGLRADGTVTLTNPSAEELLGVDDEELAGKPLEEVVPEFATLFKRARKQDNKPVHDHVHLIRNNQERIFAVRVTTERSEEKEYGYVVTFDDITELVAAQRTAAWADIARRIAHEIKNPLTPIQLSAERIKRKYNDAVSHDREVFDQCTDTIIRQVGDIGRMVDEFSAFARMPKPVMETHDIGEIVREAVFLFHVSHPHVTLDTDLPAESVMSSCDRRLLSQAITNLVKNATEAIETKQNSSSDEEYKGAIMARLRTRGGRYTIEVIDNGAGLPKEGRNRLVEPYMTTRDKGTGLGLAIVQKITEQHGGTLQLRDAPKRNGYGGGACVRLDFPVTTASEESVPEEEDDNSKQSGATTGRKTTRRSGAQRGKQEASHGG